MDDKRVVQLIACVVTLGRHVPSDALGEIGRKMLQGAKDELATLSGRTVTDAFLRWFDQGQLRLDPRPALLRGVADATPRGRYGAHPPQIHKD